MKLKLTIALVILALVLGMVLAACDDGELPTIKDTIKTVKVNGADVDVTTDEILDKAYVPYFDGNAKDPNVGKIEGKTGDTSGFKAPSKLD